MRKFLTEMDGAVIVVTIILLSLIIAVTVFNIHQDVLKARNIDTAIEKGIDPLSVRCSYANSQDIICIAFAASSQSHNVVSQIRK
jgi:hypothetical protein